MSSRRRPVALAALLLPALCAFTAPASAHPEPLAPDLRPDVAAAGHTPAVVMPHTQWSGFLTMVPGTNVTAATYQVCRVGYACFSPPAPATLDGHTFRFHTAAMMPPGAPPVDFQPGWHLGVRWQLTEGSGDAARIVPFPPGVDLTDAACAGDAAAACQESHYLTFDVAQEARGAPGPPAATLAVALLALLAGARRWGPGKGRHA